MLIIPKSFFERKAEVVAKDLLGKIIVRKLKKKKLKALIVETEAYYGTKDPASRAYSGKKTKLNAPMWGEPGTILVYMVHGNWLFNIVTGEKDNPQAVLIRAVEPLNFKAKSSGPGKVTKALKITKKHNWQNVCSAKSKINVLSSAKREFKIGRSHRIGVRKDLKKKLRFFILGNEFVSKYKFL